MKDRTNYLGWTEISVLHPGMTDRLTALLGRRAMDPAAICSALCATPTLAAMVAAGMGFPPHAAQAAAIMRALGAPPPIHPLALCEMPSETLH